MQITVFRTPKSLKICLLVGLFLLIPNLFFGLNFVFDDDDDTSCSEVYIEDHKTQVIEKPPEIKSLFIVDDSLDCYPATYSIPLLPGQSAPLVIHEENSIYDSTFYLRFSKDIEYKKGDNFSFVVSVGDFKFSKEVLNQIKLFPKEHKNLKVSLVVHRKELRVVLE